MKRIQRKRTKGWKMPKTAVYVGRPTKWGNPFKIIPGGISFTVEGVVQMYRYTLKENETKRARWINEHLDELRGKDLVCWCPLGQPCHADVLIELCEVVE